MKLLGFIQSVDEGGPCTMMIQGRRRSIPLDGLLFSSHGLRC